MDFGDEPNYGVDLDYIFSKFECRSVAMHHGGLQGRRQVLQEQV